MKNFIIFFAQLSVIICSLPSTTIKPNFTYAQTQNTSYGYYKCLSACLFFKTSDITDMNISNIYFLIPEGYFVKKIDDISPSTIKVSYGTKTGYVMSERVKSVSFLPRVKYLENITFDINPTSGTQLWLTPSSKDNSNIVVKLIPAGTKNLTYIAKVNGEIPTGSTSSVWFYCYYSPAYEPTSVYEGYIHSEKTINLTEIPQNKEDETMLINNHKPKKEFNF